MINERKSSCEARRVSLLQVMKVSMEIPHEMRYWPGAAKCSVYNLQYLSRPKGQIIWNLQRGRSYCARPRARRGHNDETIPFWSSYLVPKSATSER